MKKIFLILLLSIFLIPNVDAKELYCDYSTKNEQYFERFGKDFIIGELNSLLDIYNTEYIDTYSAYSIDFGVVNNGEDYLIFTLILFKNFPTISWNISNFDGDVKYYQYYPHPNSITNITKNIVYKINSDDSLTLDTVNYFYYNPTFLTFWGEETKYSDCYIRVPFYSSIKPLFVMPQYDNITQINLQTAPGENNYDVFTENSSDYIYQPYSTFLELDPSTSNYTEVNLDDYEYVILNLKNYNQDAFNTSLKVKGMIGITPIYEFGTVEKETITDRCNLSYSDYTNYRFSILKNDLINNAIYAVKSCEDNSSFKFDSSIFDITYVTADNVDDPVITVGGQNYHTIPFNKLSNSANKNEENNFIPGESTNGTITTITDTITSYISNFWNGLVTFMGLVTKFFNTLPLEIRSISIVAFSVGLTLGIIKFIKS